MFVGGSVAGVARCRLRDRFGARVLEAALGDVAAGGGRPGGSAGGRAPPCQLGVLEALAAEALVAETENHLVSPCVTSRRIAVAIRSPRCPEKSRAMGRAWRRAAGRVGAGRPGRPRPSGLPAPSARDHEPFEDLVDLDHGHWRHRGRAPGGPHPAPLPEKRGQPPARRRSSGAGPEPSGACLSRNRRSGQSRCRRPVTTPAVTVVRCDCPPPSARVFRPACDAAGRQGSVSAASFRCEREADQRAYRPVRARQRITQLEHGVAPR